MQISMINQTNPNFKAAHMSWRTASKVGFSKRTLLKEFPALKDLADTRELLITPSKDTYEMIKGTSSKELDKIMWPCAVVGLASIFAVFYSWAITALGVFGSLGVAAAAAFGSREPDKKECHKMIIQVGNKYKNGKLEGNLSEIKATYDALKQHPYYSLLSKFIDKNQASSNRKIMSDMMEQLRRKERLSEKQIQFIKDLKINNRDIETNRKHALMFLNSPAFYLAEFELMSIRDYLFPDERELGMHELPFSPDHPYNDNEWHIKRDDENSSNISDSFVGGRRYTIAGGVPIPQRRH